MNIKLTLTILVIFFFSDCKKNESTIIKPPPPPNTQHISVVTQHNDNTRAGLNNQELKLTTSNVNTTQFGKLFSLVVDDQVYAQPLMIGNLSIGSGNHNVVFIATVNNSVYAYD